MLRNKEKLYLRNAADRFGREAIDSNIEPAIREQIENEYAGNLARVRAERRRKEEAQERKLDRIMFGGLPRTKEQAEKARHNRQVAKMKTQSKTPMGAMKLAAQWHPTDILVFAALTFAILKDIIDLALGWIPGVGTVITLCTSLLILAIFLFMLASGGASGWRASRKAGIMRGAKARIFFTLFGGTLFEIIIGLNIFPIETFSVLLAYRMMLINRRIEAIEREKEEKDEQKAGELTYGY